MALDDFSREDLEDSERLFDVAGAQGMFAALLFPRIRYVNELLDALAVVLASDRWACSREQWRARVSRPEDVPFGLHWRTAAGDSSSAMGFAPHGSMPVTRRAPYYAIVLWPGGRENPFAKPSRGVGFIDAHPAPDKGDYAAEAYDAAKRTTMDRTGVLLGDPPEDSILLRNVAFCLPSDLAGPFVDAHVRTSPLD